MNKNVLPHAQDEMDNRKWHPGGGRGGEVSPFGD